MTKSSKRGKRAVTATGLVGVVVAILWYLGFGSGLGLGPGKGLTSGTEAERAKRSSAAVGVDAAIARPRCQLLLDGNGIHLDGVRVKTDAVVKRCKRARAADLVVTGAARFGELESLQKRLKAAGVAVYERAQAPSTRDGGAKR